MSGFKNEAINANFINGVLDLIITHLIKCSQSMKADCVKNNNPLLNSEDKITNRLVARYLNSEPSIFRYETQSPENFDDNTDLYIGRTDNKVIINNYFLKSNKYLIIECKRVDGLKLLNMKYVTEGVKRFVSFPPKYSTFYKHNIIFGYVVKTICITKNVCEIEKLQNSLLGRMTQIQKFILEQSESSQFYVYSCSYDSEKNGCIKLKHLFYNFAEVMQK